MTGRTLNSMVIFLLHVEDPVLVEHREKTEKKRVSGFLSGPQSYWGDGIMRLF